MSTRTPSSMIAVAAMVVGVLLGVFACAATSPTSTAVQSGNILSGRIDQSAPTTITAPLGDPTHIAVADVGIDAAVRQITETSDEIDPPTNADAWWWTGRGRPGSADTVYIAGHTLDDGGGVFGPLRRVRPGAQVRLATTSGMRTYQVEATATYSKAELEQYDEVWQSIPGRLILVTCLLDVHGEPTTDNLLVYADLRS